MDFPIPVPPPVTMATLPLNSPGRKTDMSAKNKPEILGSSANSYFIPVNVVLHFMQVSQP